jgi:hypothetical protein
MGRVHTSALFAPAHIRFDHGVHEIRSPGERFAPDARRCRLRCDGLSFFADSSCSAGLRFPASSSRRHPVRCEAGNTDKVVKLLQEGIADRDNPTLINVPVTKVHVP